MTNTSTNSAPGGMSFTAVDTVPASTQADMVAYLRAAAAHSQIAGLRGIERAGLGLRLGQRLLDAGCGLGEVARELAAAVGVAGRVDAVDRSEVLIDLAARRLREEPLPAGCAPVHYGIGDVTRLAFADETFDVVRAERVLQHVPDPDAVLAELLRVTRRGGLMSLVDTDWQSLVIDGVRDDLVRRLSERIWPGSTTGRSAMGRTLRRRMRSGGLADITCVPVTLCFTSVADGAAVLNFLDGSRLAALLTSIPSDDSAEHDADLVAEWTRAVHAADDNGTLLAALTVWVVNGRKQSPATSRDNIFTGGGWKA